MTSPTPSPEPAPRAGSRNRLVLVVYTAAIFTSALLLFSVQPLFTKMVLPRLGGSPAVWSVAMVFFQSLLLGGYAYAHYLMKLRSRVLPVAIHLALLVVAVLTLPLSIAGGWGEPPSSGYAFWLLALFAVSIGLPFFALAANNPLLQAWFVRTGHPDGPDPYFLYASSNIGSFLALLSYPVLLEPMLTLHMQNLLWTVGYGLLILLIAACGVLLLRAPPIAITSDESDEATPAPSWLQWGRWVYLAAIPSGLLIAVTAHISTDVAAAPTGLHSQKPTPRPFAIHFQKKSVAVRMTPGFAQSSNLCCRKLSHRRSPILPHTLPHTFVGMVSDVLKSSGSEKPPISRGF